MSISSISANVGNSQLGAVGGRSTVRQARQDFDQLFQSIQSGNLSSAQQAYADLQQLRTAATGASATTDGATTGSTAATASSTTNPVITDWTALGQALQSGSATSAQDALSKLKQDATTQWQSQMQNAQAAYALMQSAASTNTTAASAVSSVSNAVQTDLSNLSQSLQSGDTAGAQKLLAKLEQDMQSSGQTQSAGQSGRHHHHHGGFASQSQASSYAANATTTATSTTGTSGGTSASA